MFRVVFGAAIRLKLHEVLLAQNSLGTPSAAGMSAGTESGAADCQVF